MELVNVSDVDPTIMQNMIYATENNFVGRAVYPSPTCLLRPKVAQKLAKAQALLAKEGAGLCVYDAYRPLSVQRILFEVYPDPNFVADPEAGSVHNRGAAVDVSLVDIESGEELAMPTAVDAFVQEAYCFYPHLPEPALRNRALLQYCMIEAGFEVFPTEWWHFNCSEAEEYDLLDIDL